MHLYEEYGVELLHRLRGMFGLALWDERRRELILARDRLGIKPLHYAITADGLYFASEQNAILAVPSIQREVDLTAPWELFALGFCAGRAHFVRVDQPSEARANAALPRRRGLPHTYWTLNLAAAASRGGSPSRRMGRTDS